MPTRIAFFASDPIALPVLHFLNVDERVELVGVMAQPDRPVGRGQRLQPNPIKAWASEHSIPVLQPEKKPGSNEIAWLNDLGVELIFVMAFGHILPNSLLEQPRLGIFNFHTSLLPKYRGASPIEGAIAAGDSKTGVTLMQIIPEMDAGDTLDKEIVSIQSDDTTLSLSQRLAQASVSLIERNLEAILFERTSFTCQNQEEICFTRKLTKTDGWLNFNLPAKTLLCRIRAVHPWPGAFFQFEDQQIKIGSASLVETSEENVPGTVLSHEDGALRVATGEHALALNTLQRPGGKMLSADDFLRGYPIPEGAHLESGPMPPLVSKTPFPYNKKKKSPDNSAS